MTCFKTSVGAAFLTIWGSIAPNILSAQNLEWQDNPATKSPYIFTQQHNVNGRDDANMRVQLIRLGWSLQVQLPGNPAVWTFDAKDSDLIEPRGRTMVYSPTRIEGTESLFVFDFALPSTAKAGDHGTITLSTTELPQSLENVMPNGVFVVNFSVIAAIN